MVWGSSAWGRLRGDSITVYKYLKGRSQVDGVRLFAVVLGNRTRGNVLKLEHRKFHVSMKNFFTLRVMEHWSKLPREVVESPLQIFTTHLDTSLCNLL